MAIIISPEKIIVFIKQLVGQLCNIVRYMYGNHSGDIFPPVVSPVIDFREVIPEKDELGSEKA